MLKYPWYELVDGKDLQQGDLLRNCPIINSTIEIAEEGTTPDMNVDYYDVVVMSQSCDIAEKKIGLVLVCPYWELKEFVQRDNSYNSNKRKEALRRDDLPGFHMLLKCEIKGFESDHLIVDFRNVYGVSLEAILALAEKSGKRLRLLPPYRERLSQAFARFFMRVGLPEDIPPFL